MTMITAASIPVRPESVDTGEVEFLKLLRQIKPEDRGDVLHDLRQILAAGAAH